MLVLREHEVAAVLDMDAALAAVRRAQLATDTGHGQVLAKGRARGGELTVHAVGGALELGAGAEPGGAGPPEMPAGADTGALAGAGAVADSLAGAAGAAAEADAVAGASAVAGVKAYVSGSARAHWVLLFDGQRGLRAVVAAEHLGRLRTGAASAVAAEALARGDAAALVLFGAGRQAFTQVEAVSRVRELRSVTVVSRTEARARAMAERIGAELGLPASVAARPAEAVAAADIVITITTAREPVLAGAALTPGTHVVLAGSSHASRREADAEVFARAALVTTDDVDLARSHGGDLIAATAAGALAWDDVRPLGWALDPANRAGLDPATAITVFCSHGIGTWDLALASTAVDRAEARGLGVRVPLG
jgi:ornithine cyclodeaminase/alanine dehydrogenase